VGGEALPRLAAAEALRSAVLDDDELARVLAGLRGDGLVSPSLFLPALAKAGDASLHEAAEAVLAGWRPSHAELGPLLSKLPAEARSLIEKAAEEQQARLLRFEPLLKGGDPAKGRETFYGKKFACCSCHSG